MMQYNRCQAVYLCISVSCVFQTQASEKVTRACGRSGPTTVQGTIVPVLDKIPLLEMAQPKVDPAMKNGTMHRRGQMEAYAILSWLSVHASFSYLLRGQRVVRLSSRSQIWTLAAQ